MRKPATAHVFKASVKDKPGVYEGIWFDASLDTKESAEKSFVPLPNGEGYLYDGVVYSDVDYIGVFSESAMPRNDSDCLQALIDHDAYEERDAGRSLDVVDAAYAWASSGMDEDYMFGYTEYELRNAL